MKLQYIVRVGSNSYTYEEDGPPLKVENVILLDGGFEVVIREVEKPPTPGGPAGILRAERFIRN